MNKSQGACFACSLHTRDRYHGGRRPSSDDSFTVQCHSTIGTRQTEYHEALPLSVNDVVRCDCTLADDGDASWYSVCRVLMVEWRLDCENCRHLTVVGLRDTGPMSLLKSSCTRVFVIPCIDVGLVAVEFDRESCPACGFWPCVIPNSSAAQQAFSSRFQIIFISQIVIYLCQKFLFCWFRLFEGSALFYPLMCFICVALIVLTFGCWYVLTVWLSWLGHGMVLCSEVLLLLPALVRYCDAGRDSTVCPALEAAAVCFLLVQVLICVKALQHDSTTLLLMLTK